MLRWYINSTWGDKMFDKPRYLNCGDTAITVEIDNNINETSNAMVMYLCSKLKTSNLDGIIEIIPTYVSFTVFYNPLEINLKELFLFLEKSYEIKLSEKELINVRTSKDRIIEIPVLYGGEFGIDLDRVATHNNLCEEAVINLHSKENYLVYMIGFTPGFPYLGGMNNKISTPRLEIPRKSVPRGSVGIAGDQTGIYPLTSPGGWNIIGRTPLKLFDPSKDPPTLFKAGDVIKFVPIDLTAYNNILNSQGEGI